MAAANPAAPAIATALRDLAKRGELDVPNPELAASAVRTAQALADAHPGFPALAAAAAHSQGLVRRDPDRLAQAATQHPDPWARASAAEDLGVLHGRHSDRDQAIHYLKEAFGGYRQVGADRDQARVRRRLRQLGIRRRHWATLPARPVIGWDSLTGTEQAVAGLVAQGLNNGQVAARMYISTHTVAHHLRQAFRKLSIASRYELTRIVIEQAADSSLVLTAASSRAWPPTGRGLRAMTYVLAGRGTGPGNIWTSDWPRGRLHRGTALLHRHGRRQAGPDHGRTPRGR